MRDASGLTSVALWSLITPMTTPPQPLLRPSSRHFGLDWLRIGAFVLLIFYHIGMVFAPGTWMIKTPHVIGAVAWPMVLVQPWRMPLLFAVSGYASYALLSKSSGIWPFARLRTRRLLLPLLFGTIFIVAPQWWVKLSVDNGYTGNLLRFWWDHWLAFRRIDGQFLPETGHLWFIAYLWTYTLVLALLVWAADAPIRARLAGLADWLGQGWRLLWAPLAPLLLVRMLLLFTLPEKHGLIHDWVSDATFFPPFLLGFALAANPGWWTAIRSLRWPAALVAIVTGVIVLAIEVISPDGIVPRGHVVQALQRDAALTMAWSMLFVLLGLADRYLNHDHRWRAALCEAVFPFYIAHQTIIVLTAWALLGSGLSALPTFALLIVATFGGCWLFYRLAIISGPLREWLGLNPARKGGKPVTPSPAAPATI